MIPQRSTAQHSAAEKQRCHVLWPLQRKMSPTSRSVNVMVAAPALATVKFSPGLELAGDASNRTFHKWPSLPAVAVAAADEFVLYCFPLNVTATSWGAAVHPHTGTILSRCSTMLEENILLISRELGGGGGGGAGRGGIGIPDVVPLQAPGCPRHFVFGFRRKQEPTATVWPYVHSAQPCCLCKCERVRV